MNLQTLNSFSLLFEMSDDGSELLHVIKTAKTIIRDADTDQNLAPPKLEAVAVTEEEAATLLGAQTAALTTQVAALTSDRDAKAAELATTTEALTAKEASLTAAQAQIAALQEQLTGQPQDGVATVTAVQARLALAHPSVGKMDEIDAFIQALPASDARKIFYEYALTWRRDNPHVIELAGVFGIEDDEIDALFALAATLG